MNVHMLRHIPDCVRNWGPMWAYSCFSFESQNGHLKKLYHGTRCMNVQVSMLYVCSAILITYTPFVLFVVGFLIHLVAGYTSQNEWK